MDVGMTLPVTEPGFNRDLVHRWATEIDQGPFSTLAAGERMAFPNLELFSLLGACAAWTNRVSLMTTVIVLPIHNPLLLAKKLATLDVLSDGRVIAGLGSGGRIEDYLAVGADPADRKIAEMVRRVAILRRVWAGEKVVDELLRPVEPRPVRPGGIPIMAGALGPKAIAAAATWADGLSAFSFGPDPSEIAQTVALARAAWKAAGKPPPRICVGFWYGFGDGARDQMKTHLRRYMNWMDPETVETMIQTVGLTVTAAEFKLFLRQLEDIGVDEALPVPTDLNPDQARRVADIIG